MNLRYLIEIALVVHTIQILFFNWEIRNSNGMFILAIGWLVYRIIEWRKR